MDYTPKVYRDKDGREYIIAHAFKSYPPDAWLISEGIYDAYIQQKRQQQ